ncbi:monovalent cation/H(+) antiporter subunit G [Pontiellaceae bacterium B12227]|nr:monovalent cation/H(+) antiporter subunit G [Pontiellaceae bacterium B12227]
MRVIAAAILISLGILLWFWGGFRLISKRRYLWKIHALGISDTIGSCLILAGALVHSLENWSHLVLALGSVVFWGTAFSIVMARMGKGSGEEADS